MLRYFGAETLPKRHSICLAVFRLIYLIGMSKSAADRDTAPLSPSQRRSQNFDKRNTDAVFQGSAPRGCDPPEGLDPTPKLDRPVGSLAAFPPIVLSRWIEMLHLPTEPLGRGGDSVRPAFSAMLCGLSAEVQRGAQTPDQIHNAPGCERALIRRCQTEGRSWGTPSTIKLTCSL